MENTAQPSVFISSQGRKSKPSFGTFLKEKKVIIGVLVAVLILVGVFFISKQVFFASQTPSQSATEGELTLTASQKEFSVGDIVAVTVNISTGGYPTLGTDVIVKYDPNLLEIDSASSILDGDAYPEYPSKNFDQKTGLVSISGISALNGNEFNGVSTFATINFKAKGAGTANISLDFTPGGTADSNIIKLGAGEETSIDILSNVSNLSINIVR